MGKKDVRINRKMGHITFIDCDKTKVREFINNMRFTHDSEVFGVEKENGKYKGGNAGDQTGTEVCIRVWYNRPWNYVIRCKDRSHSNFKKRKRRN